MIRRCAALALSVLLSLSCIPPVAFAQDTAQVPSPAASGPLALKGWGHRTMAAQGSRVDEPDQAFGSLISPLAIRAIDAIPLPASPVSASLSARGQNRLYATELTAGDRLSVTLTSADAEFDVYLYAPGLGLLADATAIAHASEGAYPRTFTYDVPSDISGTYYLEVYAYDAGGAYELTWDVTPAGERARKDIGAARAVGLPLDTTLSLEDRLQANEIYAFYVAGGRRLSVDLAGPADADFDVYLYAPGTSSILPTYVQPLVWSNGKTSNESLVFDVPMGSSGLYYLEVVRFSGSGDARLKLAQAASPAPPSAVRVSGVDRFTTAIEVAKRTHPAGSATAVLCSGRSFPDGLSASSLAGALEAPVLLTDQYRLPDAVGKQLRDMRTTTVYVVGGSAAVGFAVETDLARWIPGVTIVRVAGASRYETAGEVADWVHAVLGERPGRVFLASGTGFPDALALSPLAYSLHAPILLTTPAALPASTKAAIERTRGDVSRKVDILVAGGTVAVSDAAAAAAASAAGGTLSRAAGSNRYETALTVAEKAIFSGWAAPDDVAIASGTTFPDSLGGAALPGGAGGVLLLCPATTLGPSSSAFLKSFDFAVERAWVLGGAAAVTEPVLGEVRTILPDTPHLD